MSSWPTDAASLSLEDRQAIVDVTIRYSWALDQRDFADLGNVFTDDAVAEYGFVAPIHGAKAIADYVASVLEPLDATQHLVANHQVAAEGEGAVGRCYLQAQHTKRGLEGGENYIVAGLYRDRFVRTGAGWRIAHRVLEIVWTEGNPAVVAPPRR